jgi:hypothetical protein
VKAKKPEKTHEPVPRAGQPRRPPLPDNPHRDELDFGATGQLLYIGEAEVLAIRVGSYVARESTATHRVTPTLTLDDFSGNSFD